MSRRARRARVLAGALTRAAGVAVVARYERDQRGYRIEWTGGPDEQRMRALAGELAGDFSEFDLDALGWHRLVQECQEWRPATGPRTLGDITGRTIRCSASTSP